MPRVPVENNDRMSLRIAAEEKTLLVRAAALQHTNLTEFVIRTAVATAKDVIDQSEQCGAHQSTTVCRCWIFSKIRPNPTKN